MAIPREEEEGRICIQKPLSKKEMQALKDIMSTSFPQQFTLFCNRPTCNTFMSLMSRVTVPNNSNRFQPDYDSTNDTDAQPCETTIEKNQAAAENNTTLKEKVEAVNKTATNLTSSGSDSTKMPPEPKMTEPLPKIAGLVSEASAVQNQGYKQEVVIDLSTSSTSEITNQNSKGINEIEIDSTEGEGIHQPEMTKLPELKLKAPIREDEKITDSSSSKNLDMDGHYRTVFDEIGEIFTPIFSFFSKSMRFLPISEPDKQLAMQVFGEETDDRT